MVGAIRKWDILAHPFVTIHCFGWHVFLKALLAGRDATFLSIVAQVFVSQALPDEAPELIERCAQLELRAKRIFEILASIFSDRQEVRQFLLALVVQEQDHADLLRLCAAAGRGRWVGRHFDPWRDVMPRLENRMKEVESSLNALTNPTDALRLVITIESSEVNRVFRGVVEATDSTFVRRLDAFQKATAEHLTFICQGVKTLAPELEPECEDMRAAHQEQLASTS